MPLMRINNPFCVYPCRIFLLIFFLSILLVFFEGWFLVSKSLTSHTFILFYHSTRVIFNSRRGKKECRLTRIQSGLGWILNENNIISIRGYLGSQRDARGRRDTRRVSRAYRRDTRRDTRAVSNAREILDYLRDTHTVRE